MEYETIFLMKNFFSLDGKLFFLSLSFKRKLNSAFLGFLNTLSLSNITNAPNGGYCNPINFSLFYTLQQTLFHFVGEEQIETFLSIQKRFLKFQAFCFLWLFSSGNK